MSQVMTPAGWYPDPAVPGVVRWWDGHRWTPLAQPAAPLVVAPAKSGPNHILHLLLTVLTCGAWGVVWLALGVLSTRPDRQGPMSRWSVAVLVVVILVLAAASAWSSAHDVISRGY